MSSPQGPVFDPNGDGDSEHSVSPQVNHGWYPPPAFGQNQQPTHDENQMPAYGQVPTNYNAPQPQNQEYPQFGSYQQAENPTFGQPQPNPKPGVPLGYPPPVQPHEMVPAPHVQPKSRVAAALLAFFLGTLGIHNFYLGRTGRGVVQLVLTLVGWATSWLIVGLFLVIPVGIWVFVEFILILVGSGSYGRDARGVPLA